MSMFSLVRLGEVVDIKGGGTPSRRIAEYWNGQIPWATVKDLKGVILSETEEYVSREGINNSAANVIPAGNIIIATRMALGRAAINTVDMAINQDLKALKCNGKVDARYLLHFLNSKASFLENSGKGATVKGITLDVVRDLEIPLPPLPEQRRIAAILDKAAAIRRKRQQAIRLTEEFLRSVFLDMFGDPVTNPKGWEVKRLDEISDIQSGITKGRKANVQDGHIDLDEIKEIEATSMEIARYLLKKGDILLTEGGDPDKLGRGAVWYGEIDPCIHQNHIFRVRPNTEFLLPEYASAQIGSIRGKKYFLKSAKQTTGIASINKTQLSGFPTLIPPVTLQEKFVEIVRKQKVLVTKNNESATNKDDCFNSIVQRAFRGEL